MANHGDISYGLDIAAGKSVRRNAGDTAFEAFEASTPDQLDLKATQFPGICAETPIGADDIILDYTARTLTIVPPLGSFHFFTDGSGTVTKHVKTGNVVFPAWTDTYGVWNFSFDTSGNPVTSQSPWTDFDTVCPVFRILWNPALSGDDRCVIAVIETHENTISADDHAWKHRYGAIWYSGGTSVNNKISSGTPNADGRNTVVSLTSCSLIDDNLLYTVANSTSGAKFTQDLGETNAGLLTLSNSALFRILYQNASNQVSSLPATRFPFPWDTGTNRPEFITNVGVRTLVPAGDFFVTYAYAIQDPRSGYTIKLVSATQAYGTLTLAQAASWADIQSQYTTINDGEVRPLYKMIFQYNAGYSSAVKYSALRQVDDIRKNPVTNASTLSGSLPATSVTFVPSGNIAATNAQSALEELDSEKTSSAIVPSTAPAAAQILVGNAGGTAYAPVSVSGDATITSLGVMTLKNSGVSGGSYTLASITVDAQGRVTSASNGSAPFSWASSASGTSGSGLTLTVGNSSGSLTSGLQITIGDTQANSTIGAKISLGTSNSTAYGLYIDGTSSGNARCIQLDCSGSVYGIQLNIGTTFSGGTGIGFLGAATSNTGWSGIDFSSTIRSGTSTATSYGLKFATLNSSTASSGAVYGVNIDTVNSSSSGSGSRYGFRVGVVSSGTAGSNYGFSVGTVANADAATAIGFHSLGFTNSAVRAKFLQFTSDSVVGSFNTARTTDTFTVECNRERSTTSGTVTDNFNIAKFTRRSITTGAGGTLNSNGAVLAIENIATQTAGTLTDTVTPLLVVQGANSTGAPIDITQNAVVSTNYRKLIRETVTGITIWMGNGNTANGVLSGTAGDILLNGGTNKPEYCTGTTNWTALV